MVNYIKDYGGTIRAIAQQVIKKHFNKMANIKIEYRFIDQTKRSKGRVIFAEPKKVAKLYQSFIDADLIIIVSEKYWDKYDNLKREAMIHEAFCQVDLIPKDINEEYPKRIEKDLYELSDGQKIKGIRQAKEAEENLVDYDIKLLAYDENVLARNIDAYGCWKRSQECLKHTFVQTKLQLVR